MTDYEEGYEEGYNDGKQDADDELDQWREVGRLLAEIFNYDFGPDVDEKFMPQVIALLAKGEH